MRINATEKAMQLPKYRALAHLICERIDNRELRPGDRLPSIAEMCREFGVTNTTANQVYNVLEQEGVIVRLQGKGTFVAENAKKLKGNIGLLLDAVMPNDPYAIEVMRGVQQEVRRHGSRLTILDQFNLSGVSKDLEHLDGLLFFCDSADVMTLQLKPSIPQVLLVFHADSLGISNVVADDFEGARIATRYLISLGHRRISFILSSDHDSYSPLRFAGYQAALKQANIPFDPALVTYVRESHISQTDGIDIDYVDETKGRMLSWMEKGWADLKSTAILAPNDYGAVGILQALSEKGLSVPADVSVVGFDDLEISQLISPALTTIRVPLSQISARATNLLFEKISNGGSDNEKITLPVQLKERSSTKAIL